MKFLPIKKIIKPLILAMVIFGSFFASNFASASVDLGYGLVGHWKMNDNVSTTAVVDSVGGNNGTATFNTSDQSVAGVSASTTPVTDHGALNLAGNKYITLSSRIEHGTNATINAWVKDYAQWSVLCGNLDDGVERYLYWYSDGNMYIGSKTYPEQVSWSTSGINFSGWHMLTITKTGTTIELFVDNVSKGTRTLSSLPGISLIGEAYGLGQTPGQEAYLNKPVDDFRIYNRVINSDERTALYNSGAGTEKENCATAPDDPLYTVCTYTGVGTTTFTPPAGVSSVSVLVVAGGGGGGIGGGGGAGGLVYSSSYNAVGNVSVIVGTGGVHATKGNNSVFGTLTAEGGGRGGNYPDQDGGVGGCGGGAGMNSGLSLMAYGGAGTQGYNGGQNTAGWGSPSGGGGGMGAVGQNGPTSGHAGDGGIGLAFSISGISKYYAGGGGGGAYNTVTYGTGGLGGGGNGIVSSGVGDGGNGEANTGGGGGGGGFSGTGGVGGSGVVIVRYLTPLGNGLVAHYKMNDNLSTTNVIENKGGNDGTSAQNTSAIDVRGKINGALSFNGSTDYITGPALSFGTGDFSVSFWSYRTAAGFQGGTYITTGWTGFSAYDNTFIVTNAAGTLASIGIDASMNTWEHHTLVVNQASSPYIKHYINGILNQAGYTEVGNKGDFNPQYSLKIGATGAPGFNQRFFNGSMDDVRIYNRALSQADVTALYNWGDGTEDDGSAAITISGTGTQISTTTIPVTGQNLGGAFLLTSTINNATTTSIRLKNTGSISTSTIANIVLAYKNAAGGQCSSTKPSGTTSFGTAGAFDSNGFTTTTGTIPLNKDVLVCIYVNYNLTGSFSTSSLGNSIDFEINNPSADIVSTGGAISTSNSVNISGQTIVVNDASQNPTADPTSCTNSGITSLLSLKMDDPVKNPTVFYLENCAVWKIVGGGAPIRMTNPNLQVLSLTFTNLTGANNGGSVRINMTMSNVNASSSPSYINTRKTYSTTATVKTWGGN